MEDRDEGSFVLNAKEYNFIIEFPTCNSFRQVLEFLNNSHKTVPLCFSKKIFSIRKANDSQNFIGDFKFKGNKMLRYYVDELELEKKFSSENPDPELFVHVPIPSLLSSLKKISKSQRIWLAQRKGKENCIQIFSNEFMSNIIVDPSREEPIRFEVENPINFENPNVTMQLSAFHYAATGCGKTSDRFCKIQVYEQGAKIFSDSAQGDLFVRKGYCTSDIISEVPVPGDTMKSISKLSSLSDEGIVSLHSDNESYMCLSIPISVIGEATFFLIAE
jgi:hypothetical protein